MPIPEEFPVCPAGGGGAAAEDEGSVAESACRGAVWGSTGLRGGCHGVQDELPWPQPPPRASVRRRPGHRQPPAGGGGRLPLGGVDPRSPARHVLRAVLLLRGQPGGPVQHGARVGQPPLHPVSAQ